MEVLPEEQSTDMFACQGVTSDRGACREYMKFHWNLIMLAGTIAHCSQFPALPDFLKYRNLYSRGSASRSKSRCPYAIVDSGKCFSNTIVQRIAGNLLVQKNMTEWR